MAMAHTLPLPRQQQQQKEEGLPLRAKLTPHSAGSVPKTKIQRRVLADVTNEAFAIKTELDEPTVREEDTLRCQVKSLLQKLETDIHRSPNLRALSHINGFLSSPTRLAAPTPTTTALTSPSSARRIPFEGHPLPVYVDRALSSTAKTDTRIAFNIEPTAPPIHNVPDLLTSVNVALLSPALRTPVSSLGDLAKTGTPSSEQEGHGSGLEEVIYAEEAQDRTNDVLENPVTRALLFGSPEKHSAVEITMSSLSAAVLSEVSPILRESHADESSDWSVLVACSPPSDASDRMSFGGQAAAGKAWRPQAEADSKSLEFYPSSIGSCKQEDAMDGKAWAMNCTLDKHSLLGDAEECTCTVDDSESIHRYAESVEEDDNYKELCTELEGMTVGGEKGLPEYKGKRTCFIYNSDDEIEQELDVSTARNTSPNVLHLRGLPTPKGKHLRFPEEDFE